MDSSKSATNPHCLRSQFSLLVTAPFEASVFFVLVVGRLGPKLNPKLSREVILPLHLFYGRGGRDLTVFSLPLLIGSNVTLVPQVCYVSIFRYCSGY